MANGTLANEVSYLEYQGKHKGIMGWLLSVDHKRIGLMYLMAILIFFFVAMTLGVLMRLEMLTPGETIMKPSTYNSVFTLHGVIMVFLFIIPAIPAVFGNFMLPIQIGAKDVAFPRLNLFSWYLYMVWRSSCCIFLYLLAKDLLIQAGHFTCLTASEAHRT